MSSKVAAASYGLIGGLIVGSCLFMYHLGKKSDLGDGIVNVFMGSFCFMGATVGGLIIGLSLA